MTDKKDDDTGRKDGDGTSTETDDDNDDDDGDDGDDEAGWSRMKSMIDESVGTAVGKALGEWSANQKKKTTSSNSRHRQEKKSQRKTGFLSTQFFSGLNNEE